MLSRIRRPVTRQWHWYTISIPLFISTLVFDDAHLPCIAPRPEFDSRHSLNGFACIWLHLRSNTEFYIARPEPLSYSFIALPSSDHWHSLKQPAAYIYLLNLAPPQPKIAFTPPRKHHFHTKHTYTYTLEKMSMDSNWSLDYCLACDRQTSGGAYCSQACRLGDLETSSCASSEAASPTSTGQSSFWASSMSPSKSGFYLQPAIDFGIYRSNHPLSSPDPRRPKTEYGTSYFSTTFQTQTPPIPLPVPITTSTATKQILTTSSSQSSLASLQSKASTTSRNSGLSTQAKTELRNYANSFDLLRVWKRRMNST